MPAAEDLKAHAISTTDFYEMLSVPLTFGQKELDRAWRRTALKYHPDKVGASNEIAREIFFLANIGYEILSDPTLRALYDDTRSARERKAQQSAQFEVGRRKAMDELEKREHRAKRSASDTFGTDEVEEKLEREVRRLAEDGKRRRKERKEALQREILKEEEEDQRSRQSEEIKRQSETDIWNKKSETSVSEIERTVKARFVRSSSIDTKSPDSLYTLFSNFGPIDDVFLMKDKQARIGAVREKQLVGTGVVVFHSIIGAHAAIEGWTQAKMTAVANDPNTEPQSSLWKSLVEVTWATGQEPDCVKTWSTVETRVPTLNPEKSKVARSQTSTKLATSQQKCANETVAFLASSPYAQLPVQGMSSLSGTTGSPSLEEQTLLRLRHAEKRRLESGMEEALQQEKPP